MNRKEAAELLPIIKAFAEGKEIEIFDKTKKMWETAILPHFDYDSSFYRIKPEPTYIPFKDAEECWQEMQKHQPFGWVIPIGLNQKMNLKVIGDGCDLEAHFKEFTFADGTPFGVKVEE